MCFFLPSEKKGGKVKFPDNMSPEFKSFLQGLLNKAPNERLTWPELL